MIAKINLRNTEKQYTSYVFATFGKGWDFNLIVFNSQSETFEVIKMYDCNPSIYRQVIIIDSTKSNNWITNDSMKIKRKILFNKSIEDLKGCDWIIKNEELFNKIFNNEEIEKKYLDKAKKLNSRIKEVEWVYIKKQQDIDNLMYAALGFHDSMITKINYNTNYGTYEERTNEIEVRFEGVWNCTITMIFSGDFTIKINRDSKYTCEISEASVFIENGNIYWVDAVVGKASEINDDYDYIRATSVCYKLELDYQ